MKKGRNILLKINQADPTPDEISKYKNFSGFVNQFYRIHTPAGFRWMLKNNMKKLVFIILMALMLLLWYLGEL